MEVLRDPLGNDDPPRGGVLSIGNFDGVHLGHQTILSYVAERAQALGAPAMAMTFDPHPVKLLRPADAPRLLTTLEQRLALIARTGIETCLLLPFTHRVARMTAADFVRDVLVERLAVRDVYIGKNFKFGADRGGDVELLTSMGNELGFEADYAPIVEHAGGVVSSTRVRQAVAEGRVEDAAGLLGRSVFIDGPVLEGKRLGRTLGFPTLNMEVENELMPDNGVYVTAVHIPSFDRTFTAVTNIGVRPTIYQNSSTTVESHLLDFTADVYREWVRLFFLRRLREEREFDSTPQLMAQIRLDVEAARRYFDDRPLRDLPLVLP
ncbi:MAG: bifunctional riboflavin kinase/FAD synthetase [Acidobacteria bacterium]|nr:bifunctional riboflavin kinase/FAD synthetase [Acidobacteriota bacterium]